MGDDGSTLEVKDAFLTEFAAKLEAFATLPNTALEVINSFADGHTDGVLLAGSGALGKDADLQAGFKALCVTLKGMVESFKKQISDAQVDLATARLILDNAHDEALTAAEMLRVLEDVLAGGKSGGA